jgi:hypothetical protein
LGKGLDSTLFERKSMSTKTTLKRIALVAVSALGFGLLSVAPSQAANGGELSVKLDSAGTTSGITATGIAGANNFVTIAVDTPASGAPTAVVATGGTLVSTDARVSGSGTSSIVIQAGADLDVNVPTPTAGTITVKSYAFTNGVQGATAVTTVTITVLAAAAGTVYQQSTAFISTTTGSSATADTAAALRTAAATASNTAVAQISVKQYASVDTATVVTTGFSKAVTVEVSGAGSVDTVSSNGQTRGPISTVAAAGAHNSEFLLFADGRSGTATITIKVNAVVVKTTSFVFYGTTVGYYVDDTDAAFKTNIGVGSTGDLVVYGVDANGNDAAAITTLYAVSSDTNIATVSVSNNVVTVTGRTAGKATISICSTSACAASATKISIDVPVSITKTTAASVALTFDKAEYLPGEKMTITLTAKDADGNALADGTYATLIAATGVTSNVALQGSTLPTTGSVAIAAGKKSYVAFAPLVSGPITLATTRGQTATAPAVTASATVGATAAEQAAQAAADAAAEAIDAANAATDAANLAAEAADAATVAAEEARDAADAATAAVEELATQVATLFAALRAQLTTLANTVAKIAKKVRA